MAVRSKSKGNDHEGGHKRPFTVVPDDTVEDVYRDVNATFLDVPFWAVEHLFQKVRTELEQPDMNGFSASLVIEFDNLSERQYEHLIRLRDLYWLQIDVDVKTARLYPPYKPSEASNEI